MKQPVYGPNRRTFLKHSGSCTAWLMALTAFAPTAVRRVFDTRQENERLFAEKWGWIEKLGENVWTHIATPFEEGDYTTTCNGGIIAGTDRVLVVESFMKPEGAKWMAERCKELTGRWPTDVVVTHFHADHVGGSMGYKTEAEEPKLWLTDKTVELVKKTAAAQEQEPTLLDNLSSLSESAATEIDLGGRTVKLMPAVGHTPSDLVVEVTEPHVVFTGDLFWNRLVPNYRDSRPRKLTESVTTLLREDSTQYVPGHGTLSTLDDVKLFQRFLATMEEAARKARSAGKSAEEAAAEYKLTGEFADWHVFAETVIPRIFAAWYRELQEKD